MLFHILVFDFNHSSYLRGKIPKEIVWHIPVMVTFSGCQEERNSLKLPQLIGNYFKRTWKTKETEKTLSNNIGRHYEEEEYSAYKSDPEV